MTHASVFSGIAMEIKEEWKPVTGYEGKYEVSNLGNINSVGYGPMKPHKNNKGYLIVGLRDGSGNVQYLVHRRKASYCRHLVRTK